MSDTTDNSIILKRSNSTIVPTSYYPMFPNTYPYKVRSTEETKLYLKRVEELLDCRNRKGRRDKF